MALDQSALLELLGELQSTDVSDRIRLATQKLYQELIDAEATAFIGAASYERSEGRVAVRNGSRPRTLTTTAGDLDLRIPKLRQGSFFPSLLERRRRVDQALFAVVMEAYVHGVSTRKVDDLVKALGADSGISKSEVSRICQDLDEDVAAFRERPLDAQDYPYVFVDATYCKARVGRQVVSQAIVVAIGVASDGTRQVLGFDVGDTESEPFWTAFFRSLKARGLGGVRLVISDAHSGLIKAIQVAFQGVSWQRCRVHFMRNVLAKVPKVAGPMVASIIRTVFVPRGKASLVKAQFGEVVRMLERSHPAIAEMLEDARDELLAFTGFPAAHWQQIWSTNPLERLNKEIKRRTDVVGTFPNPAALLRLAGHVLIEQHDEWDSADRRYFSDASMALLNTTGEEDSIPELIAA
ncbi:IS256 family transposase [Agromyces larvae]|uniref:Mutator family transposase n=1 Tax=Agromyces larvae TaxID=2929802 RepID=A0ABY4BV58_9MICO|nr:IS256 family transposase [Agromyces larvae]UOE42824.1 IS256 family transposase [Agromyces larvae]UOE43100.1 IS256 family transposase [Agromyces larvae]UOE43852.1 IS256 family transposase [Agromyces larvae]UOE43860.1 IS256 family transposase [Agromyces larvae]UOE43862.1 IS256 family transposase [Agromyces larvae]